MDLNKYKVSFIFKYEGCTGSNMNGYEIVFAGSPASAKLVAKAQVIKTLKKQGAKLIFIDFQEPVLMH